GWRCGRGCLFPPVATAVPWLFTIPGSLMGGLAFAAVLATAPGATRATGTRPAVRTATAASSLRIGAPGSGGGFLARSVRRSAPNGWPGRRLPLANPPRPRARRTVCHVAGRRRCARGRDGGGRPRRGVGLRRAVPAPGLRARPHHRR